MLLVTQGEQSRAQPVGWQARGKNIFQSSEGFLFSGAVFSLKALLEHQTEGWWLRGREGGAVHRGNSVNANWAALGWSLLLQIQIAPGVLLFWSCWSRGAEQLDSSLQTSWGGREVSTKISAWPRVRRNTLNWWLFPWTSCSNPWVDLLRTHHMDFFCLHWKNLWSLNSLWAGSMHRLSHLHLPEILKHEKC